MEYATVTVDKDMIVKIAMKENITIKRKMRKQRRLLVGIWCYVCS